MNIETYGAFVIATIILMLIPGPTVLLVISYALAKGRSIALAVVGGAVIGVLLSMVATLLGVGLILVTSKTLFIIMKWIGVVYLAWMGWKMIRTSGTTTNQISSAIEETHFSAFRDSMIVTFFNPKSIGFFCCFCPTIRKYINPFNSTICNYDYYFRWHRCYKYIRICDACCTNTSRVHKAILTNMDATNWGCNTHTSCNL
ncbi:MAG: hypothetical protein CML83_05100 [Rhodobiaceae bacterium]|nr:hypothetical protein [Rhodobiaceae bacterium]OUT74044.1 MAG: hypothetical protein CBB85_04925 [Rhizobiales bacterium TMED25]